MKKKDSKSSKYQLLSKSFLSSIKGGSKEKEEEEYITIYITQVSHPFKKRILACK